MEEVKQEEKEKPKQDFNLVEIPTGKQLAIQDKDGDVLSLEYCIVWCMNEITKLKKTVG